MEEGEAWIAVVNSPMNYLIYYVVGNGKTTIFNGLLGNRPDVLCWASDYLIWSSFWSLE
jgi:hypothetical protein